jgi:hypothetical protein
MTITRELEQIAARELHVSHSGFARLRDELKLAVEAFGSDALREDFIAWCQTPEARAAKYPGYKYLKVVDARLRPMPTPVSAAPTVQQVTPPATEAQLNYLRILGVVIPDGVTKRDAGILISRAKGTR